MRIPFNPWSGLEGLPRQAWILCAVTLINRSGTMVLPFLVLYLVRDLGFSPGRAGLALTVYGGMALVAAPLSGRLCDRFGHLQVMRAALFFSGIVLLFFPLARSWPSVVVATLLFCVGSEAFRPATLAILSEVVRPDQRKRVFALNRLAVNLGMSVGPAVGGFLAAVSFHALFWVDGVTSILAGIALSVWGFRESSAEAAAPRAAQRDGTALRSSRPAHTDTRLLYGLVAAIPVYVVFVQHSAAMPLYLVKDLGFRESVYGLLFSVNTLLIVFLEVQMNTATAHWPHRRSLPIGALLCAAGFGSLALVRSVPAAAATVVVWTFGEMILFPAMSSWVAEVSSEDRRGETMGLYTMSFGLAFSFGPWLGTEILERLGATALWGTMFVLGAVSAGLLTAIPGAREDGGSRRDPAS